MEINELIREFLISYRDKNGLTQEAMANILGIKLRTYAKIDKTGEIKTVEDVYSIIWETGMDIMQIIAESKGEKKLNKQPPKEKIMTETEKDRKIVEQNIIISTLTDKINSLEAEKSKKAFTPRKTGTGE